MLPKEFAMGIQRTLPAGRPVGGKAVHGFGDTLGSHTDTCLDEPECKRLGIVPQAVLSRREDQTVWEGAERGFVRLDGRTEWLGRVCIAHIKIGVQLFRAERLTQKGSCFSSGDRRSMGLTVLSTGKYSISTQQGCSLCVSAFWMQAAASWPT